MVNTIKGLLEVTEYPSYRKPITHTFLYFITYITRCSLGGTINSQSTFFLDWYVISEYMFI